MIVDKSFIFLMNSESVCASATVRTMSEDVKKKLSYADSATFKCQQLPGDTEVVGQDSFHSIFDMI